MDTILVIFYLLLGMVPYMLRGTGNILSYYLISMFRPVAQQADWGAGGPAALQVTTCSQPLAQPGATQITAMKKITEKIAEISAASILAE
jgi:hypothetical protein